MTYFDAIPYDIYEIVIYKLDNKNVYNFLNVLPKDFKFDFVKLLLGRIPNISIPKVPIELLNKFLFDSNATIGGSFVVANILQEKYPDSDIDIYINIRYLNIVKKFLDDVDNIFGAYGPTWYKSDPSLYFAISGQNVKSPEILYRLRNIDIVIVSSEYNPVQYLQKITDFTMSRSFITYKSGKRHLAVDYIDDLFSKKLILNHDKSVKPERYFKYEQRGFDYVLPTDTIDIRVSKYLDLLRSFLYPIVLVSYGSGRDQPPKIWGNYPSDSINKLNSVVPVACKEYRNIDYWNEKIFNNFIFSYRCYISLIGLSDKSFSLMSRLTDNLTGDRSVESDAIYVMYSYDRLEHLPESV